MNNYKYLIIFVQKNWKFDSKLDFPSTSIKLVSLN